MLHLINDYYLDTDKWNYILTKRMIKESGKNKGTEYFVNVGYYGKNLKMLKKAICEYYILEGVTNVDMDRLIHGLEVIITKIEGVE